jgi:hypothetical protein
MRLKFISLWLLCSCLSVAAISSSAAEQKPGKSAEQKPSKPVEATAGKATDLKASKPAPAKPGKSSPGYHLTYRLQAVGRIDCLVSEDGAKITTPMFSLLVLPPDYRAILFNPQAKKMISMKKEKMSSTFSMFRDRGLDKKYKFTEWKRLPVETVSGLKCDRFQRKLINTEKTAIKYSEFYDDFWVTNDIRIKNYRELMSPLSSLSNTTYKQISGIPVRHQRTFQVFFKGDKKPAREDVSNPLLLISSKRENIEASTYAEPKGYTVVADETELLFNDDGGMPDMSGTR